MDHGSKFNTNLHEDVHNFQHVKFSHCQRRAANSYPPAYPGCHGLCPQLSSSDTLNLVCSWLNEYGKVVPNHMVYCALP